jgi:hypothetical protein
MKASGDGFWELALTDGSAWFSEWFHHRLRWIEGVKRATFNDLHPFFSPDAWDMLLQQLRAHLEQKIPFSAKFPVQLAGGHIEWWHMRGSAQLNDIGHPIHIAGSVSVVTAESATGS